jgi:hypothetical protein
VSSPASDDDDDIPATPRNTAPVQDTDRDLELPESPASAEREMSDTLRERRGKTIDTLLSNRPAADRVSEVTDPRIDEHDRRLEQLEARMNVLELARGVALAGDRRWLIWVGLLLALALGWQLRAFFT